MASARRRWMATVATAMAGAALVLPSQGARAATTTTTTVTVPGATITRVDDGSTTTVTVRATTARLDLWCSSGALVANGARTSIPCSRLRAVTTTGLTGADRVAINATGFGSALAASSVTVKTGAGDDTVSVRHHASLTVWGGSGDDVLEAGLAAGSLPVSEVLYGEDGADQLRDLGFLTAPVTPYDPVDPSAASALRSKLRGGPGADRLTGDATRWTDATLDATDVVDLGEGPATLAPEHAIGAAPAFTYDKATGYPGNPDTLRLGTTRSLAIGCSAVVAGSSSYVVSGLRLPVPCAIAPLDVIGTAEADAITYDQRVGGGFDRYGPSLSVSLGGGDDVASVRAMPGTATVDGGAGADRITVGVYGGTNADGTVFAGMGGGEGDDVLTSLGFLTAGGPTYDPAQPPSAYDVHMAIAGGPGADRLTGAATLVDDIGLDVADTLVDGGGPATYRVTGTSGPDAVDLRLAATSAGSITITTPQAARTFVVSPLAALVTAELGAGADTVSVTGGSARTATTLLGGTGSDRLAIRTALASTTIQADAFAIVQQPGLASIAYERSSFEQVSISRAG